MEQLHSGTAGYLLEAEGLGSFLLIELPLLEVQHGLIHIDDAQLHLLLQGNELPLAWRLHPSKWVVDARWGPVPPWPHKWLWKERQTKMEVTDSQEQSAVSRRNK